MPPRRRRRAKQVHREASRSDSPLSGAAVSVRPFAAPRRPAKDGPPFPWGNLSSELKLKIARMCDCPPDVRALGLADPKLIPLLVKDPELEWCQRAYAKAINGASGPALVEVLRQHLPSFWASSRDYFSLRDDESIETILELCRLRAGRGPEFLVHVEQDDCQARCNELPDEIHLDLSVSKSLFVPGQAAWILPTQVDCLFFDTPEKRYTSASYQRRVRGRQAFTSSQQLDRITISHLDLTRGRLDLSKIAGVIFIELWDCTIGIGDFGLRRPAKVLSLRLFKCTFVDQSQSFELPEDLQYLDMVDTTMAGAAPNWQLPTTLTDLSTQHCSIATQELPAVLPPTLRSVHCTTEHFAPRLRTQDYPQTVREIEVGHLDRAPEQTRRIKLFKRNWQRELEQRHPEARVKIR